MLSFYRYISYKLEVDQIVKERKIQSTNPKTKYATWYTPTRYDDPKKAQQELALSKEPTHCVGPIPADQIPDFDIELRHVAPKDGHPGGGVEARTRIHVYLFGLRDFNDSWLL